MRKRVAWVVLGVVLLALGLRLVGIGSFMTVDEENWMIRSGTYWHNLFRNKDTGGAFMTTHPGATLMWISGAGIVAQEARVGFDVDTSNLIFFHKAATVPVALATSALLGVVVWLLAKLYGLRTAGIAGVLIAAEPYLVGMSQVAHLDALLAFFMLISLLSFWQVRERVIGVWGRDVMLLLILSGVSGGLAMGTKLLSSLWLFVFFAAVLLWQGWQKKMGWAGTVYSLVRTGGFVFGVAALTFYVVWPALWFSSDVGRSFNKDVPVIITDEHVALEQDGKSMSPRGFYARTFLGRLTPYVHFLAAGAIVAAWLPRWRRQRADVLVLFLYALGFFVLITLVAKKGDRYALPGLIVLPVVAGLGVSFVWDALQRRWQRRPFINGLIAAVGLIAVVTMPLLWSPHAIAYNNPFFPHIRHLSQQGWGEGLEEAAQWLNERPRANEMYIASWYTSVMQTYFEGKTLSLSSRDDYRVQYVVTYRNMGGRAQDEQASNVLDEVRKQEPVHTVYIQGTPYAWIYETLNVGNFTRHVGEVTGDKEIGQTVRPKEAEWSQIEVGFATFSSRKNTKDVLLHIKESPNATEILRTVKVNARDIVDNEWQPFVFEPIENAADRDFYVAIVSPDSVPGNAVTVRYIDIDVREGQMFVDGVAKEGDIAYRIGE